MADFDMVQLLVRWVSAMILIGGSPDLSDAEQASNFDLLTEYGFFVMDYCCARNNYSC
jgi:hypothetical protein